MKALQLTAWKHEPEYPRRAGARPRTGSGRGPRRRGRRVPLRPAPDARLRARLVAVDAAVHARPRERRLGRRRRSRRGGTRPPATRWRCTAPGVAGGAVAADRAWRTTASARPTSAGAGGGLGRDGGMAPLMLVPHARWLVPLGDLDPVEAAPLTDAGLTPYHAVKRSLPLLVPGSTAVVIGAGGLGHMAVQFLRALSPATVIAVDQRAGCARSWPIDVGARPWRAWPATDAAAADHAT